ncbi:MAG: RNA polymerase factor sigma-54 [Acidobacteria bacterium]|nr:RNA polymerase factor sigma-54 [Acidobacteriota bacterium]
MSTLSPRLQLGVAQKQILTPGLVQMVTILQMTRMELKDMIVQEIAENPVLEEAQEGDDHPSTDELRQFLEAERVAEPSDRSILEASQEPVAEFEPSEQTRQEATAPEAPAQDPKDPFDEIDYGSFFDEYLDPGYKSPASEISDKPSFETFLSSPVTLSSHLDQQLAVLVLPEKVRDACDSIIGNLDQNGYLMSPLEEIAVQESHDPKDLEEALHWVQTLDPAGVGCRDLRECLLIQLKSRNAEDSVAWKIVHDHLKLLETKQMKEIAKVMGRPLDHIQIAANVIRHLDPTPGLRYSGEGAQKVEPDVYIFKDGEDYLIELNDDDLPQVRLNPEYRRLLDREQEPNKDTRNYIKDRYQSALQLIKNIEQRKQTIVKVCQAVIRRQNEFLDQGLDFLRPMMIKDVADEIGVHPSTVSRAVAAKYVHTPQGVFELRFFFGEAVQGSAGASIPLLTLKRMVKKMIEEEDPYKPLTDEQITEKLQAGGIDVTRRTVAKYREDMKIPSTHQRRKRE